MAKTRKVADLTDTMARVIRRVLQKGNPIYVNMAKTRKVAELTETMARVISFVDELGDIEAELSAIFSISTYALSSKAKKPLADLKRSKVSRTEHCMKGCFDVVMREAMLFVAQHACAVEEIQLAECLEAKGKSFGFPMI